jgi:DNA-binding YbaB/EbfC family protein
VKNEKMPLHSKAKFGIMDRGASMNINPLDILKNAQQIQASMGEFQEKLAGLGVTGSAGGGMVEIDMNGKMEVLAVRIASELVSPDDIEMLQDLIVAAFSSALEKARMLIASQATGLAGGMDLSGIMNMLNQGT